MKRKKDIGLQHIQKLGIRQPRSGKKFIDELEKQFGDEKLTALDTFEERNIDYYQHKNQDYDFAMSYSGGFDADIIRHVCNWIDKHKECFGKRVLEIGCDCGFMTTFLSYEFPDSEIVSIDRSQNGIIIAKRNVELFNGTNVEFKCCDVAELDAEFDTVFSLRTVQENRQDRILKNFYNDWRKCSDEFVTIVASYSDTIRSTLKKDGILISIERMNVDPLFLGWLKALNSHGVSTDPNMIEVLTAKELDVENTFPIIIGNKKESPVETAILEDKWLQLLDFYPKNNIWDGWSALVAVQEKAGDLIDGYEAINKKSGEIVGKIAYYSLVDNQDAYLFSALIGGPEHFHTEIIGVEEEYRIRFTLDEFRDRNERNGFHLRRLI
jgi:SAM-dependent methyltransferase